MRSEKSITRRDAIRILGAGAGLAVIGAAPRELDAAVANGPIIRTILRDIPPDRLTGPTLIHEHLSISRTDGSPVFDDLGLMADEREADSGARTAPGQEPQWTH